jgi:hypothetical protein
MKDFLFAIALMGILPGAALGATATSPLSAQVVVSCDIGPPAAIPPAAAAAGFTHCVANWDFSQPIYATLSHWFDCDGTNRNVIWHSGSRGVTFVNPCNIHQKLDSTINRNVMNFEWLSSYGNKHKGIGQANQIGGQTFNNWTKAPTLTFGNYYLEAVDRVEGPYCPNCPANSGGPDAVYAGGIDAQNSVEIDPGELYAHGTGYGQGGCGNYCSDQSFIWTNWGPGQNALPPGYSAFDYNNYGALLTSDGQTNKYLCLYINASLQGSGCVIVQTTGFTGRNGLAISAGSDGLSTENIDFDVQYVRVWSCDAYKTDMCNGTTLSNNGQGLIYWH